MLISTIAKCHKLLEIFLDPVDLTVVDMSPP